MNTRKSIAQEISNLILDSKDIATVEIKEEKIVVIFKDNSKWNWVQIGKDSQGNELFKFSLT